MKILIINGPNLNLLGKREPKIYGTKTLSTLEKRLIRFGKECGVTVLCMQSNLEGDIINALHKAERTFDGIIINAGGYTHTSVSIRDAVSGISLPVVEVHISNPKARESFRHISLLSDVCVGTIAGFKEDSYKLAIRWFAGIEDSRTKRVHKKN